MLNFCIRIICLFKGHDWDIWWKRSNAAMEITKRSCRRCLKIEKYYDVWGA